MIRNIARIPTVKKLVVVTWHWILKTIPKVEIVLIFSVYRFSFQEQARGQVPAYLWWNHSGFPGAGHIWRSDNLFC